MNTIREGKPVPSPMSRRFTVGQAVLAALAYLCCGSIPLAGLVGAPGALLQELMARMSWNHGRNHVAPTASAIAVGTLLLNVIHLATA
ncbi:hypothetical protein [Desulfocurvus sp. DL9XJH121]